MTGACQKLTFFYPKYTNLSMKYRPFQTSLLSCVIQLCVMTSLLLFSFSTLRCHKGEDSTARWLEEVEDNPDSVLSAMKHFSKGNLNEEQMAKYALCYTIAQDKSGIDVADDSLIHIAFDYYSERPDDELAAKCHYYMGKTFWLEDDVAQATCCLLTSAELAEQRADTATMYLANSMYVRILRESDSYAAIDCARKNMNLYNQYSSRTTSNCIHALLTLGQCLSYVSDSLQSARNVMSEALSEAEQCADSAVLSCAYQDMSVLLNLMEDHDKAVHYAQQAENFSMRKSPSLDAAKAVAYANAGNLPQLHLLMDTLRLDRMTPSQRSYMHYCLAASVHDSSSYEYKYAATAYNYMRCFQAGIDSSGFQAGKRMAAKESKDRSARENKRYWQYAFALLLTVSLSGALIYLYMSKKRRRSLNKRVASVIRSHNAEAEKERRHLEEHANQQMERVRKNLFSCFPQIKEQMLNSKIGIGGLLPQEKQAVLKNFLESADNSFVSRLAAEFPDLGEGGIVLLMLVRLGLTDKELASMYSVNEQSIQHKLYMYKSKLNLTGSKKSLRSFIKSF